MGYDYDGDGCLTRTSDMPDSFAHEVINGCDSESELEDALFKLCFTQGERFGHFPLRRTSDCLGRFDG